MAAITGEYKLIGWDQGSCYAFEVFPIQCKDGKLEISKKKFTILQRQQTKFPTLPYYLQGNIEHNYVEIIGKLTEV